MYLGHVVLHHEGAANYLYVDRHRTAVVGRCCSGGDMIRWCATLILCVGQVQQPVGNVDALDRGVDRGGLLGFDQHHVGQDVRCSHVHAPFSIVGCFRIFDATLARSHQLVSSAAYSTGFSSQQKWPAPAMRSTLALGRRLWRNLAFDPGTTWSSAPATIRTGVWMPGSSLASSGRYSR